VNRYKKIQVNKDSEGKRYYSNAVFPDVPL